MFFRTPGITKTYPTLKTSANFRNAELMRIGNGYFWKSLGKRTTASHCSPSLPDLRPSEKTQEERITKLQLQAETASLTYTREAPLWLPFKLKMEGWARPQVPTINAQEAEAGGLQLRQFKTVNSKNGKVIWRLGIAAHTYNHTTWEVEAKESVQGHPLIHSKFEATQGCIRPSQKKKRPKHKQVL